MIVIGVDVHKQSLTAAVVDETGRLVAERTLAGGEDGLLAWAVTLRRSVVGGRGLPPCDRCVGARACFGR
jgi:hypothetical protein